MEKSLGANLVMDALGKLNNQAKVEDIINSAINDNTQYAGTEVEALVSEALEAAVRYGFLEATADEDFRQRVITIGNPNRRVRQRRRRRHHRTARSTHSTSRARSSRSMRNSRSSRNSRRTQSNRSNRSRSRSASKPSSSQNK